MRYTVSGVVTVGCWTEVEANSEEEAIKIAEERDLAGLCYSPFSGSVDEEFHFSNDGEPKDFTVEQN